MQTWRRNQFCIFPFCKEGMIKNRLRITACITLSNNILINLNYITLFTLYKYLQIVIKNQDSTWKSSVYDNFSVDKNGKLLSVGKYHGNTGLILII